MPDLARGLYEVLITAALEVRLGDLGENLEPRRSALRAAEAADRMALHLGRIIRRALESVDDDVRVATSVALARRLLEQIDAAIAGAESALDAPLEPGVMLRTLLARLPDGTAETMSSPLIPLLDTTLLTNA